LTSALIERRAAGAAMVVVTHNLVEGLALATHVAIMRNGRFARLEARAAVDASAYANEYREMVTIDA
jgi:ABC-type sugar transport system ATPase subunit